MDADIYVLANNRNKDMVLTFLDKYLPQRKYGNGKLEYWNDASTEDNPPTTFFDTEEELFDFLEKQSNILFLPCFYPTTESEYRLLQLYYFEDDSLVYCINIYQYSDKEDFLLEELKTFLGSDYGYIAYHIPPAYGKEEFIKAALSVS